VTRFFEPIGIISLGCPKNIVDSERILGKLLENGIYVTFDTDEARTIIINTCAFLQPARDEAEDVINEFIEKKKKGTVKKIIVSGCYPSLVGNKLMEKFPRIDAITGTNDISHIVDALKSNGKAQFLSRDFETSLPARFLVTLPHYAYLKIADGCNHRCAFCLIPQIKGSLHSLKKEFIIKEAKELARSGAKELIITAQDTTAYGKDIYGKPMLISLLKELEKIDGIEWIRILYTYPGEVTEGLAFYIAGSKKVVPYIDMPIQHISDKILGDMNRMSKRKNVEKMIEIFRKFNIAIRTTLIVGFPGEGEKEFDELREFVEETKFDYLGVFPYFREEGTASYLMDGQVDISIKIERKEIIESIQEKISLERNRKFIGKSMPVIMDYYDQKKDLFVGRTIYDAPEIDNIVFVKDNVKAGSIYNVKIEQAEAHTLEGRPLRDSLSR